VGISNSRSRDTATTVLERLKSDQGDMPRFRPHPDYHHQISSHSGEFSSALSPFCPLPDETRSAAKPPFLHSLHVPINVAGDRISPSSPTFSGSTATGGDISPTTPDSASSDDRIGTRSPLNSLDDWSAGRSKSPGRALLTGSAVQSASPMSPKQSQSADSPRRSISSDGSSPHLRACNGDRVPTSSALRPLRPW